MKNREPNNENKKNPKTKNHIHTHRHSHARKLNPAKNQWLTPVILATQETEIRRIMIQRQPQANSSGEPILKISNTKKGV
jgi:hypothetical protein